MKKSYFISLLLLAMATVSFAQDYEVRSVEHLPLDMTAKINNLTERPNGGQNCAVLRIATQNILAQDRNNFQFRPDMGSHIRERRTEGGEILLWVSPGINYLTIKHKDLGNTLIYIPELLHGEVESLNTYRILIVGTKELPKEPKGFGSCNIVFRPSPNDAVIYLNGDSIGAGYRTVPTIAGTYHWTMDHPLYHAESGIIELVKGKSDTVDIALSPAYGYMKIIDDYGLNGNVKFYINGEEKGKIPYESEKLASGMYHVAFEKEDTLLATGQIEVKDNYISVDGVKDLFNLYQYKRTLTPGQDSIVDSLNHVAHTRFVPLTGKITINSIPESTVSIDGVSCGHTPLTIDTLPVGMYELELTSSGYSPLIHRISVKEGEETTYNLKLPRACVLTITSDEKGDQVYIDSKFVGKTPVTMELPFGAHTVFLRRLGKFQLEKTIYLDPEEPELTIPFSFGQLVTVEADRLHNRVYVDGEFKGKTPIEVYLPNGKHTLRAERGWKTGVKKVSIEENQVMKNCYIETQYEKPKAFLSHGAFFMTGNVAWLKPNQVSYGFNIGDIANGGTAGWYLSFVANTDMVHQLFDGDFSLFDAYLTANETGGYVSQFSSSNQPQYSGETSTIRASALFGVALRMAGPVYLRLGAGAGLHHVGWKTTDNEWVVVSPDSWKNVEASMGLQCCIYNFVLNTDVLIPIDVLTEKKSFVEFRVGLGFCTRHKNSERK